MTSRGRAVLTVVFYAALCVLLLAILVKALPSVLPDLIAGRISRNSEGVTLTLLLAPWIQFVRPRIAGSDREWIITGAVALVSLAIGVLLFATEPINQIKTLNESFLAAAVLIPYVQLRRPLPVALPLGMSLGIVLLIVLGHTTEVITLTAEGLGALVLAPIAFDLVDRAILDPTARTVLWHRLLWYVFLVAGPVVFWATDNGGTVEGGVGELLTYAGRTTEIFLCLLAVELFFAVALGRDGRHREPAPVPQPLPLPKDPTYPGR